MRLERIKIKNYKVFKDAEISNLGGLCVFIGTNGSGKSTLFEVLGFLKDCLRQGVDKACDLRGGFISLVSGQNTSNNKNIELEIELDTKVDILGRAIYRVAIGFEDGAPVVVDEALLSDKYEYPLLRTEGGVSYINYFQDGEEKSINLPLEGTRLTMGSLSAFSTFAELQLISSYFDQVTLVVIDPDLTKIINDNYSFNNFRGRNLAAMVHFLKEGELKDVTNSLNSATKSNLTIGTLKVGNDNFELRFHDNILNTTFLAPQLSDGTMKLLGLLVYLQYNKRATLFCIEEPENHLHPDLMQPLYAILKTHVHNGKQVFIATHSVDLANQLEVNELFFMHKENGYSTIHPASEDEIVRTIAERNQLGWMWRQNYIEGANL